MRDLIRLLAPQRALWPLFLLGIVISVLSVALGVALFTAVGMKIDAATMPVLFVVGAGTLRSLALSRTLMRYLERIITHDALFRGLAKLRIWLFARLVPLSPAKLSALHTGDILARLTSDIDALDGLYLRLIVPLGVMLCTLAGLVVYGVMVGWLMAAGILIGAFLYALALVWLVAKKADTNGKNMAAHVSALRRTATDSLEGMADILTCRHAPEQLFDLQRASENVARTQVEMVGLTARASLLSALLSAALVLWVVALPHLQTTAASLGFWTSLFVMLALGEVIALAPSFYLSVGRLKASAQGIVSLIDLPVAEPAALQGALPEGALSVVFDGVTFSYTASQTPVLADMSFTIEAGAKLLITGPSGAGKSSIAGLLLKFWQPQTGRVLMGGVDIAAVSGDVVRGKIGYLMQDQDVMSGSLRENLQLGKPAASEAEMQRVLASVGLSDLLAQLPDGLDTWVGENGTQMSGGQGRRVAIARLLLKDAPVWLCDEPTEGLDDATAREVLSQIIQLAAEKQRTLLLITHQPEMALELTSWQRLALGD